MNKKILYIILAIVIIIIAGLTVIHFNNIAEKERLNSPGEVNGTVINITNLGYNKKYNGTVYEIETDHYKNFYTTKDLLKNVETIEVGKSYVFEIQKMKEIYETGGKPIIIGITESK
ncbi:hypothetical protein [Methanobrevibacter curvatus]|uniref:DUF3221 domain-containing protein n=1 Tax=Methanobrevibacter curvatus TaxID=49547 RepID=A0A166BBW4_9EURY|nr:hypothetical protein [Methanobrevibacter curvatus]KZX13126.1 hypothetical protein MBCUR_07370 [Methanobrevibacter curvatus]